MEKMLEFEGNLFSVEKLPYDGNEETDTLTDNKITSNRTSTDFFFWTKTDRKINMEINRRTYRQPRTKTDRHKDRHTDR